MHLHSSNLCSSRSPVVTLGMVTKDAESVTGCPPAASLSQTGAKSRRMRSEGEVPGQRPWSRKGRGLEDPTEASTYMRARSSRGWGPQYGVRVLLYLQWRASEGRGMGRIMCLLEQVLNSNTFRSGYLLEPSFTVCFKKMANSILLFFLLLPSPSVSISVFHRRVIPG